MTFKDQLEFVIKLKYKDIVFLQSANGLWTSNVLNLITQKTCEELKKANKMMHEESVWHTLVGLKLLEINFESEKSSWKLVAMKARSILKKNGAFKSDLEIQTAIQAL